MEIKLNCLNMDCPMPVVKAKKELEGLEPETWLSIDVDGEIQVQNLTRMANNAGYPVRHEPKGDNFTVFIQKKETRAEEVKSDPKLGKTVIAFSSDKMGHGDEELGEILMKSFCFSMTQMDPLPDTLIFYNTGVHLTTTGSKILEDLYKLKQAGVEVYSCGTCLKHLGIEDQLEIGSISNMYEILEMQMKAGLIIRP